MARCAAALLGTAILVAAVDLAHKAGADATSIHDRSAIYVVLVCGLSVVWAAGILLTRSPTLGFGGGVVLGGAVGNVVSLAVWSGVPDPLDAGAIAFNLADVFVLAGFVLVAAATLALVARDPERLREPVRVRRAEP